MRNTDYTVPGIVLLLIFLLFAVALGPAATGTNQSTDDVTAEYALPEHLSGCRVYRMTPKGFGQTIYAVTRGAKPVATVWNERNGKTYRPVKTVTP